jgi:hypothetical protein
MKRLFIFTTFLLYSTNIWSQKSEEKLVADAYANYKSAILTDQGEEALKYLDSRTVAYYGKMAKLIKSGDSITVDQLPVIDKIIVFSARHRASKEDIRSFDGSKLLIYAIKTGMVGKNSVAKNEIGKVSINDSFAKGQFIANGTKTDFYMHFYKEDNQWKIDLTALFPVSANVFQKMVDESGMGENEFLFYLLEAMTGRKPTSEIWSPLD